MSRSNGLVIVECDCCGAQEEIEMTMLASKGAWDDRNVDSCLSDLGWITDEDDDLDFCSEECAVSYKKMECKRFKKKGRKSRRF